MLNISIDKLIENIILDNFDNVSSDFESTYMMMLDSGEVAIAPLLAYLESDEHNQHHIIASILCDILVEVSDENALGLLIDLLDDPRNEVFTPAVRAVARFKSPQINQVLCQLLDHPAPQVRRVVAWQLGRNEATKAFSALIDHLDEIDIEVLRGIIWSLGIIGNDRAIVILEPFTKHLSTDIAFIAKEAIQRIKQNSQNS